MVLINCCVCRLPFMIEDKLKERLLEKKETFFCPMGHPQSYTKSTSQRLKEEFEEKELELNKIIGNLRQERYDLKNENKELKKEECGKCGKKVLNLEAHKKRMHS